MVQPQALELPPGYGISNVIPSYLKAITNADYPDFRCFFKALNSDWKNSSPSFRQTIESTGSLDYTGSPMKFELLAQDDSFHDSADLPTYTSNNLWLVNEESYIPTTMNEARDIMQKYLINTSKFQLGPNSWVWSHVDCEEDAENRLMYGQGEEEGGMWSRAMIYVKDNTTYGNINLSELIKLHSWISKDVPNKTNVQMWCEFNIVNEMGACPIPPEISDQSTETGCVALQMRWNKLTLDFALLDVSTTLVQEVTIGHPFSAALNLWNDLCILEKLYNIITEHGSNSDNRFNEIDMPGKGASQGIPIIDLVKESLNQGGRSNDCFYDDDGHMKQVLLQGRPNCDFTDHLWTLLKDTSTYRELIICLKTVFQELGRGFARVLIRPSNPTRLGSLMRDLMSKRVAVPYLTGPEPLELLLEAGIEKVCQDYIYLFKSCNLADVEQLNLYNIPEVKTDLTKKVSVVPRLTTYHNITTSRTESQNSEVFENSRFCAYEFTYKFKQFARLQVIVEHLLLAQHSFELNSTELSRIAKEISSQILNASPSSTSGSIDSLKALISGRKHILKIPFPKNYAKNIVSSKDPACLRVTFISKCPKGAFEESYYYCSRPIFPPNMHNPAAITLKTAPTKGSMPYHCYRYLKISDKIKP